MKRHLVIAMTVATALAAASCGTATAIGPRAPLSVAASSSPDDASEVTDGPPDSPDVVVTATSPGEADVRRNTAVSVIPLKPAGRPTRTARRTMVLDGMWIAAGIGVVAGLVSGNARDRAERENPGASCDPFCGGHTWTDAAVLGAVGIGVGAAVASIVGRF